MSLHVIRSRRLLVQHDKKGLRDPSLSITLSVSTISQPDVTACDQISPSKAAVTQTISAAAVTLTVSTAAVSAVAVMVRAAAVTDNQRSCCDSDNRRSCCDCDSCLHLTG